MRSVLIFILVGTAWAEADKVTASVQQITVSGRVTSADISPSGTRVFALLTLVGEKTVEQKVRVWDLGNGTSSPEVHLHTRVADGLPASHQSYIGVVQFRTESTALVVLQSLEVVELDVTNLHEPKILSRTALKSHRLPAWVRAVSAAGSATGVLLQYDNGSGGELHIRDKEGRSTIHTFQGDVTDVDFDTDGRTLAVASTTGITAETVGPRGDSGTLTFFTAEAEEIREVRAGYAGGPIEFANGKVFAAGGMSTGGRPKVVVIDVVTRKVERIFGDSPSGVRYELAVSEDAKIAAGYIGRERTFLNWRTFHLDGKMWNPRHRVWDVATGKVLYTTPQLYERGASGFAILVPSLRLDARGTRFISYLKGEAEPIQVYTLTLPAKPPSRS